MAACAGSRNPDISLKLTDPASRPWGPPPEFTLFVIGRVLTRGLYNDWLALKQLYGVKRLRHEVTRLRSLDPRTLAFCSV